MFKPVTLRVEHPFRKKCGISMNEYSAIDYIHSYQVHPDFGGKKDGWCDAPISEIVKYLGFSKASISKMLTKAIGLGAIEVVGGKRRTTDAWNIHYDIGDKAPVLVYDCKRITINEPKTHIYLMKNKRNGFVKIGKSISPKFREKTLQSQEPEISMIFVSCLCEEAVERGLHEKFSEKRVRGEWFNLNDEDINFIKNSLISC